MSPLPPTLEAFVVGHLGPLRCVEPRGTSGGAFAIEAADGRRAALKAPRQADKFARELHAYRAWAPTMSVRTPRLLAASASAMLLEWIEGEPYESATLDPGARIDLHEAAGRALRSLHAQPEADPDPLPLDAAMGRRLEGWSRRAERVAPALVAPVQERLLSALPSLKGELRVPCHRDFEPRNWLVTAQSPRLALLDFEHSRPDLWLADLTRLARTVWPADPALEAAFFRGYDRTLGAELRAALDALVCFDAAGTYVWGLDNRDESFAAQGRRDLDRLGLP